MPNDEPDPLHHQPALRAARGVQPAGAAGRATGDVSRLIAAALSTASPASLLAGASRAATTTRDRQLVAIATAHIESDGELVDALVVDHLADFHDSGLVVWIQRQPTPTRKESQ